MTAGAWPIQAPEMASGRSASLFRDFGDRVIRLELAVHQHGFDRSFLKLAHRITHPKARGAPSNGVELRSSLEAQPPPLAGGG